MNPKLSIHTVRLLYKNIIWLPATYVQNNRAISMIWEINPMLVQALVHLSPITMQAQLVEKGTHNHMDLVWSI